MKTYRLIIPLQPRKQLILILLIAILASACAPTPLATLEQPPAKQPALSGEPVPAQKKSVAATLLLSGKANSNELQIIPIDLSTGNPLKTAEPMDLGEEINYTFSPDRSRLAVSAKGAGCEGICLRIIQLASLTQSAQINLPARAYPGEWVHQLLFDPSGKHVAAILTNNGASSIALVDLAQPSPGVTLTHALDIYPRTAAYTQDGQHIMLVGSTASDDLGVPPGNNPRVQALLLNAQTLAVEWIQELPEINDGFYGDPDHAKLEDTAFYQAGITFDPLSQRIYIAHADAERLTTVDCDAREVITLTIREQKSSIQGLVAWLLSLGIRPVQAKAGNMFYRSIVLSPDGQALYVAGEQVNMIKDEKGNLISNSTYFGLDVWDIQNGVKQRLVETQGYQVRSAPGGRLLLSGYEKSTPFTEIYDLAAGKIVARLDDSDAFVTLDTNGQPVLVSQYSADRGKTYLSIFDTTYHPLWSWTQSYGYPSWFEYR